MSARLRLALPGATLLLAGGAASAQDAPQPAWAWSSGALALEAGLDTYSAFYSMRGTWWNLAAGVPEFDPDRSFAELWVHPEVDATLRLGDGSTAYTTLSVGATQTLGSDAFDYEDEGTVRLGSAVVGLRGTAGDWRYDLSVGRQPYTLGTGMLLTAGSSNGFSWGGGASAQRKVWARTYMARVGRGAWTGTAFDLLPDEAPEAETGTRLRGASVEWAGDGSSKAGIAFLTVPRSQAIYPGDLAPLYYIDDGRDGLDTWHGWAQVAVPALPALGLRAEFARQRGELTRADGDRDPLEAEAWLVGASWWAQALPFAPKVSFHLARFSGDDPETATYERFDPLYWGNGLDHWWFGANGAYSWLNSNLRVQRLIVDAYASAQDVLQFQYVRASADRVNSPIQFGQGARFGDGELLLGVPEPGLSHELYLQYARVFRADLVAIAFVSRSTARDGLEATAPQGTRAWTTIGVGLTANF